jgi:DNA-binding response OmpR family regulator
LRWIKAGPPQPAQKSLMDAVASRPKLLIGIVEDDEAVLHSLEFALQAEGYAVRPFKTAEDASTCAELLDADCIVLDYGLPGATGIAVLKALRGRGMGCPAIVIASNPSAQCRRESHEVGAPLIEKPLMGEDLSDAIRAALVPSGR